MLQKYLGEFADFEKIEDEHNLEFVEDNYGIVRGFRVLHGKSTACNGYVIEIDGKKAGFSGDATKCEGLDGIVAESDVIFVDATSLKGDEDVHLGMSGCVEYALRYPEKKFYAVHRNDYDLPEDLPSNVFVPSDGEEVLI
jgi:ribonuclease BN (tRNA processing enzyme)